MTATPGKQGEERIEFDVPRTPVAELERCHSEAVFETADSSANRLRLDHVHRALLLLCRGDQGGIYPAQPSARNRLLRAANPGPPHRDLLRG